MLCLVKLACMQCSNSAGAQRVLPLLLQSFWAVKLFQIEIIVGPVYIFAIYINIEFWLIVASVKNVNCKVCMNVSTSGAFFRSCNSNCFCYK